MNIDYVELEINEVKQSPLIRGIQEKLNYYRSKIEEDIGMDLGELVAVSSFDFPSILLAFYSKEREKLLEYYISQGMSPLRAKLEFIKKKWGGFFKAWLKEVKEPVRPKYSSPMFQTGWSNAIYVREGSLVDRPILLDEMIIHELGHMIWLDIQRDRGVEIEKSADYKMWSEGFAIYCQTDRFSYLYPPDYMLSPLSEYPEHYIKGRLFVSLAMRYYGDDVFLEIPYRWREFMQKLKTRLNDFRSDEELLS